MPQSVQITFNMCRLS